MGIHDVKIINGRVVLPNSIKQVDLIIDDGYITEIMKPSRSSREQATETIDAKGYIVLPGLVDVHVHFRDPGFPEKEDFISGSTAAAAGGITTVADMPNTQPPTNSPERLREKIQLATSKSIVDFCFHGSPPPFIDLSKTTTDEESEPGMVNIGAAREMIEEGILSFKIYMPHNESPYIQSLEQLGLPLTIHAEDPKSLQPPIDGSSYAFLASRPPDAEVKAIEQVLQEPLETPIHFCHISTAAGMRQILMAKNRGFNVSCEVTPHHLFLTVKDLAEIGPIAKCYPPLRSTSDTEVLIQAVMEGQVDCLASDHAPHTNEEKTGPGADFAAAPAGIPGVETALPLFHTFLVKKRGLGLLRLIQLMSIQPAIRFNIKNERWIEKGQIAIGADADLILFDSKRTYTLRGEKLHGKSRYTPFEGWKVTGCVIKTLLHGETIFEEEN